MRADRLGLQKQPKTRSSSGKPTTAWFYADRNPHWVSVKRNSSIARKAASIKIKLAKYLSLSTCFGLCARSVWKVVAHKR